MSGDGQLAAQIGTALRAARKARGVTQTQLAAAIGIDQARPSEWERGKSIPSIAQVAAAERALGLARGGLFVAAGLVDVGAGVEGAILADEHLPEADREVLLRFYQGATRHLDGSGRRRS